MKNDQTKNRSAFILSMVIFGTVGIFRRSIPLPSSLIALVRGVIGSLFLAAYFFLRRQKADKAAIRKSLPALVISGAAIGFNWILLFEAYNYASVAVATLCYYLAPILVILASPFVLREKMTAKKLYCAAAALIGMIPISGILNSGVTAGTEPKGVLSGIGAAALYAFVILTNKKMPPIPALDKTVFQLTFASAALLPYVLLTVRSAEVSLSIPTVLLLTAMGAIHTGFAYLLYFGSMGNLRTQTIALLSYIDPILAIVLSALLLREPLGIAEIIGAVLILGAAYVSEK